MIVLLCCYTIFDLHKNLSLFQALEDFLWQSSDLLDRLEDMREDLNHNEFADDVNGAKKSMDIHNEVKKRIHKMPVETIDSMGQRLLQRSVFFFIIFIIS
jgi:triple functional domain protein